MTSKKNIPLTMFLAKGILILTALFLSIHAKAGVMLGNTRIIYPSDDREVMLPMKNTDTTQTYLVQSYIESADGRKQQNFVVTPPLFVLKPGAENKLRVFLKTVAPLPMDRETLFWMNVKAVPSGERNVKGNFVQFAITNRIKLLYRPSGLGTPDEQTWKKISVSIRENEVVMHNSTKFYMNIALIRTGRVTLESVTLAPGETKLLGLKKDVGKEAELIFINDYGSESEKITVHLT